MHINAKSQQNNLSIADDKLVSVFKCELTSNVLQRDGDTRSHLPGRPEGPVAQLLIRTNA